MLVTKIVCHWGRCYGSEHEYHIARDLAIGALVFVGIVVLVTWLGNRR